MLCKRGHMIVKETIKLQTEKSLNLLPDAVRANKLNE